MRAVTLGLALFLWSVTPSNGECLTSTPEWQMLKSSLTGIGMSLNDASQPLTDVSLYFEDERNRLTTERTALSEDRRLLELDKQDFETQRTTLEERGRLYDYLKHETDTLKADLDDAYTRGIKWAAVCGGVGVLVGVLLGAVLL